MNEITIFTPKDSENNSKMDPDLLKLLKKCKVSPENIKILENSDIFTPENVKKIKKYGKFALMGILIAMGLS